MNKKIFTLTLCILSIAPLSNSQVKKIYAYKQASIPGTIIGSDDTDIKEKDGSKQSEQKQNFNYWFYLSIPKKEKVTVTGLWIDGVQYHIKLETVNSLPVKKIINTGLEKNDTILMAPVTGNKVLLIYPAAKRAADSKYALNLARQNELVIRYSWRGKIYYSTVKKIKELTPDVRV